MGLGIFVRRTGLQYFDWPNLTVSLYFDEIILLAPRTPPNPNASPDNYVCVWSSLWLDLICEIPVGGFLLSNAIDWRLPRPVKPYDKLRLVKIGTENLNKSNHPKFSTQRLIGAPYN